ncbi:hypothetical protein GMMP15_80063 [Candidatus Magnetomoraceae bacterium gMMP-15]
MTKKLAGKKGFTLIELIMTLMIIGFLLGLTGIVMVNLVKAYSIAKENANTIQKARLAMFRLTRELTSLTTIGMAGNDRIRFYSDEVKNSGIQKFIGYDDGCVKIKNIDTGINNILTDGILENNFSLEYLYDGSNLPKIKIKLTIKPESAPEVSFENIVVPRYLFR